MFRCVPHLPQVPAWLLIAILSAVLTAVQPVSNVAMAASADGEPPAAVPATTLAALREAAMHSDWAMTQLANLTDRTGARLSGSAGLAAAVEQLAATLRSLGARVTLQPVKVPHWVRGLEQGALVRWADQPAGLQQPLHLTALGASSATPAAGITAPVLVVQDFAELDRRAAEVPGHVVVFVARFDQNLAENGHAGEAYEQDGAYRFSGPSRAAALGAVAALVRSVGGASFRLPHTGQTTFKPGQAAIPTAALAAEDADLIDRLARRGDVQLHLVLTPQTLPDADSFNVIADWPGRERPDEVVIVSGHLDSWDLGTGAVDDGVGVMGAAGVLQLLQQLDLHPRRTVRMIAWTNEENGLRGARTYFDAVAAQLATQSAAIESDAGAGHALGVQAAVAPAALPALRAVTAALAPIGATVLQARDHAPGADVAALGAAGVATFAPLVDTRHYFDIHHTAADTLDKVDLHNLRTQVATLAVLAYFLAELPEPLAGLPPVPAADH